MKTCMLVLALVSALALNAATVTIKSGDVVSLTNALTTYTTSGNIIELEAGDYDLTGIKMESDPANFGDSHLVVGTKLYGLGETRDAVRLIGDGTCRVIRALTSNNYPTIRNLTITNGYAKAVSGAANSGNGGGIYGYPTVTNCVIIGCKADTNGGGCCNYTYVWQSALINNWAGDSGGGAYQPNYLINSIARGNRAEKQGGGVFGSGSGYGHLDDSIITENSSGNVGGGVCSVTKLTNCVISLNVSYGYGAGVYSWGRATRAAYDCQICSNRAEGVSTGAYGGGAYEVTLVGGSLFANYGVHGGGAANCNLLGVDVHDNYASGYGGGLYTCNATNCVIRNNFNGGNGANAYSGELIGCDVSGTGVYSSTAVGSVFHDIANNPENTIRDNPYKSGATWSGHLFAGIPVCTNCLFRNNQMVNYSHMLFCGSTTPWRSMEIVNCTIVSNKYGKTVGYTSSADYPVIFKNCVFIWNQGYDTTSFRDIHAWEDVSPEGIRFVNCAYGTATGKFAAGATCDIATCSDDCRQFGKNGFGADPKFMQEKDADHPYALRRASPLRKIGLVEGWMATATDIRGEGYARLREGAVDIGCYECLLEAPGALLLIR